MIKSIKINNPENLNFILGQSHFIKTVEDICELIVNTNSNISFGLAFSEASGPALIRKAGNSEKLIDLACKNLSELKSGHSFIIFMENAFPINFLPGLKRIPEIVSIFCATANPVEVLVFQGELGNGILGVVDGMAPKGIETEKDIKERKDFLRKIGYKF